MPKHVDLRILQRARIMYSLHRLSQFCADFNFRSLARHHARLARFARGHHISRVAESQRR